MVDDGKPINTQGGHYIEGDVSAKGDVVLGSKLITHNGDIINQYITAPDPGKPTGDPPELAAYLHELYRWANAQINRAARIFITSTASDTPDAVTSPGTAYNFAARFRTSAVATGQPALVYPPSDDEPQTFDSFAAAFERHNRRLLLLGDPGMGKTTTLLNFARQAAAHRLEDPTAPIPILASIHTWDHQTPLAQWANPPGLPLDNQPLLYLLDGLDELGGKRPIDPNKPKGKQYDPRAGFIKAIETQLPAHAALVISSRIKDYAEIEGEKIHLPGAATLQPLADSQVTRYLDAHGQSELWQTIRKDESLLALARTPLLLALITIGFAGRQTELTNITRTDVFDHYIHARFQHERSRLPEGESLPFDEATTRELLGKIAAKMWRKASSPKVDLTLNELGELITAANALAAFCQHMNLLQQPSDDRIQFIHLALRDYCAIPGLLMGLHDERWPVRNRAVRALGVLGDPAVIRDLLAALHDRDWRVRSSAAEALGKFGNPTIIPALLAVLRDQDGNVRNRAAKALSQIGTPAVAGLLAYLCDQDEDARYYAAYTLGEIGDPAAVLGLLAALHDQHDHVRSQAAEALGKIGDPAAIPGLLVALHDQDIWLRHNAAGALGQIGDPAAIPGLLAALHDQDEDLRQIVAEALGKIGTPEAVSGLVECLSDTRTIWSSKQRICDIAAEALQQIGTPAALAALQQWQQEQHGRLTGPEEDPP